MHLPTPPILFIIFSRPEPTARVFAAIRAARPSQLFIAQDGPRKNYPEDITNCKKARAVATAVDWPCEVKTLFQEQNLGVGVGCATAIRWFFEQVEEGVVLEDDVLPEPSFFPYCAELLERYRHDTRVMHITGYNPLLAPVGDTSYYFSRYMQCWGWASWRRVASLFDYNIPSWPAFKATGQMHTVFNTRLQQRHFTKIFDLYHRNVINAWAHRWIYMILAQGGLCINPGVNLIKNIGFSATASNAQNPWCYHSNRTTAPMELPMRHPEFMIADPQVGNRILHKAFKVNGPRLLAVHLAKPFQKLILKTGWWMQQKRKSNSGS